MYVLNLILRSLPNTLYNKVISVGTGEDPYLSIDYFDPDYFDNFGGSNLVVEQVLVPTLDIQLRNISTFECNS